MEDNRKIVPNLFQNREGTARFFVLPAEIIFGECLNPGDGAESFLQEYVEVGMPKANSET